MTARDYFQFLRYLMRNIIFLSLMPHQNYKGFLIGPLSPHSRLPTPKKKSPCSQVGLLSHNIHQLKKASGYLKAKITFANFSYTAGVLGRKFHRVKVHKLRLLSHTFNNVNTSISMIGIPFCQNET